MSETPVKDARQAKRGDRSMREPRASQSLLTIQQLSHAEGVPANSIRALISTGALPAVRFPTSRRVWLRRADWQQLVERSVGRG